MSDFDCTISNGLWKQREEVFIQFSVNNEKNLARLEIVGTSMVTSEAKSFASTKFVDDRERFTSICQSFGI